MHHFFEDFQRNRMGFVKLPDLMRRSAGNMPETPQIRPISRASERI